MLRIYFCYDLWWLVRDSDCGHWLGHVVKLLQNLLVLEVEVAAPLPIFLKEFGAEIMQSTKFSISCAILHPFPVSSSFFIILPSSVLSSISISREPKLSFCSKAGRIWQTTSSIMLLGFFLEVTVFLKLFFLLWVGLGLISMAAMQDTGHQWLWQD